MSDDAVLLLWVAIFASECRGVRARPAHSLVGAVEPTARLEPERVPRAARYGRAAVSWIEIVAYWRCSWRW